MPPAKSRRCSPTRPSCAARAGPGRTEPGRGLPPLPARVVPAAGGDSVLDSGYGRSQAGGGRPVPLPGAAGAIPGLRGRRGAVSRGRAAAPPSRVARESASERASRFGAEEGGLKHVRLRFSSCRRSLAARRCEGAVPAVPGAVRPRERPGAVRGSGSAPGAHLIVVRAVVLFSRRMNSRSLTRGF